MSERLAQLCGHPVRVTVLDHSSRERVARFSGVLAGVDSSGLTVNCVQPWHGTSAAAPATIEILQDGHLYVCHTRIRSDPASGRELIRFERPTVIQTTQRRRYPRVDLDLPVHVMVHGETQAVGATIRDISAGGASLRTSDPLPETSRVSLVFQLGTGLYFQNLEAETVRCTAMGEGDHIIGLRFFCDAHQEAALGDWVRRKLEG